MVEVRLSIELHNDADGNILHMRRRAVLPGVPREGEHLTHSSGGWGSTVRFVYWDVVESDVTIDLGKSHYDSEYEDLYAIAIREGWKEL